nr:hypothetical protein [Tanacetum cinerariifolium]
KHGVEIGAEQFRAPLGDHDGVQQREQQQLHGGQPGSVCPADEAQGRGEDADEEGLGEVEGGEGGEDHAQEQQGEALDEGCFLGGQRA